MITPPPLVDVSPGDPITSQAWNNILQAVGLLVDDANHQRSTFSAAVRDSASGNPVRSAAVTLEPSGGPEGRPARGGTYVGGSVGAFQIDQLLPGGYTLTVEAEGYPTQAQEVTMPDDGSGLDVTISLVSSRFAVPNLLGVALSQALSTLTSAGFAVARVIDSHGADVPPGNVPADTQTLPVLGQWPLPNVMARKDVGVFIHVAARADAIKKVGVPDIRGMSVANAKQALEDAGLVLGTTKTVTT